jgi:hypothetical protein
MHRNPAAPELIIMTVDRYDPIYLFETVPKLKLEFEPELAQPGKLLDDDELFNFVKAQRLLEASQVRGAEESLL